MTHEVPIEPELDLHAFVPSEVGDIVDEYIIAAHAKGFRHVRLVHGRGTGVLRARVQSRLERHPLVAEFADDPASHLGATFVTLKDRN
jgi:DNA-nicking Smr family endonuclease